MLEIGTALANLPQTGVTVTALKTLDWLAPGVWTNPTDLDAMIVQHTGLSDAQQVAKVAQQVKRRVLSPDTALGEALELYQLVDRFDRAHMARSVRERLPMLSFVDRFVPHVAISQELDAALKLMTEVLAYTRMRGIARADLGVWLQALQTEQYDGPGKVRTMAWIAFEGMLPLGTDFMPILVAGVEAIPLEELGSNALFARLARIAPGTTLEDKRSYLLGVLHGVTPWVQGVVSRRGLTQEAISAQVAKWLTAVAGGTPAMGLAADALTDYFAHTGVQTVATVAIEQVWRTLRPPAHGDGKQAWTSLPLDPTGDSGHCEEGQGVAVGRDPTPGVNHIVLDAPMVSHQHLIAFAQEDGSWWVRDLGSTNGTSLNLPQRSRFTEARVTTDDVLYLGSYRLPVAQLSEGLHHSTSTASDHAVQAGGSGASEGPDVPEDPGHSTGDNAVRLAPEEADKPNEAMARCERAWMQIICLAALADDDLAGDEKETLLQVASTFPTLLDTPRRWVVRRLRRTIQAIRKQGFTAVVQQAIDALPQQEQRREALRLAALTTRADGQVHTSETRFMTLLAEALELSKADLEVAIEEADAEPTQEMAIPTFEDPPDGVSDS